MLGILTNGPRWGIWGGEGEKRKTSHDQCCFGQCFWKQPSIQVLIFFINKFLKNFHCGYINDSLDLWKFMKLSIMVLPPKKIEAYFGVKQSPIPCTLHTTKSNQIGEILVYLANTQCPKINWKCIVIIVYN